VKKLSQREKIYMGVFAVALVWGIWNFRGLFTGKPDTPQGGNRPAAVAAAPAAVTPTQVTKPPVPAVAPTAPQEWPADPFNRPWRGGTSPEPSATAAPVIPLQLSAIVVRPGARFAVINGRIVRQGDEVNGRKILRIEEGQVQVDDQGRKVVLSL
jgi:hypothetical protein